jgi:hypothetical protein
LQRSSPRSTEPISFDPNKTPDQLQQDDDISCSRGFLISESNTGLHDENVKDIIVNASNYLGSKDKPIPWKSTGLPANEFTTFGLISLCYPTLCPDGTGDVSDPKRVRAVTLAEAVEHYCRFADKNPGSLRTCSLLLRTENA